MQVLTLRNMTEEELMSVFGLIIIAPRDLTAKDKEDAEAIGAELQRRELARKAN